MLKEKETGGKAVFFSERPHRIPLSVGTANWNVMANKNSARNLFEKAAEGKSKNSEYQRTRLAKQGETRKGSII